MCCVSSTNIKDPKWSKNSSGSYSQESRNKKGFIPSAEQRQKTFAALKGHKVSQETRKKLSAANKGRHRSPCSEEHKRQISVHNSSPEFQAYQLEVKRRNGTLNISSAERKALLILQERFGIDGVLTQYRDIRYPFNCDFYIPSEDLFIELNITWTHGDQPYNSEDPICQALLQKWKDGASRSKYYKNAIYTWTDLDVRKQAAAKEAGLNYLVFYSMKDFEVWYEGAATHVGECLFPKENQRGSLRLRDIFINPYKRRDG